MAPKAEDPKKAAPAPAAESKAIVPSNNQITIPSFIEKGSSNGTESISMKDIILPRLKIVHNLSEVHKNADYALPEGHLYNNISIQDYGTEVEFIPILASNGYEMFEGKGKDQKLIARKFLGNVLSEMNPELLTKETKVWKEITQINQKTKKEETIKVPPLADLTYVFIGLVNRTDLVLVKMSVSLVNTAMQLNTLMKIHDVPAYSQKYTFKTFFQTGGKSGDYYCMMVRPAGFLGKDKVGKDLEGDVLKEEKDLYFYLAKKYEELAAAKLQEAEDAVPEKGASAPEGTADTI